MNQVEYEQLRDAVLAGEDPSQPLLDVCFEAVRLVVRTSGLPASFSPYGVWSDEAIDEINSDWTADRLFERGQLKAMLQRAPLLRVFRRMAETSVRQHLIDRAGRSQLSNLRQRVRELLEGDAGFEAAGDSGSPAALWQLAGQDEAAFQGDDRLLVSLAWGLGRFTVVRYDRDARKLSPLLDASELRRFVAGLLQAAGPMTLASLVRAIELRFVPDAGMGAAEELTEQLRSSDGDPAQQAEAREVAVAVMAQLTPRQVEVLKGLHEDKTVRELAERLRCSTGTISHERARIADVIAQHGADDPVVLNLLFEALF